MADHDQLTMALKAAAEAFLHALDSDQSPPQVSTTTRTPAPEVLEYDPLRDQPPFPPKVFGTREERELCSLTYLGAIGRINTEEKRGATTDEVRKYAIKAGYDNARAVNGWNHSKGPQACIANVDGKRILTETGYEWALQCAENLNITIAGGITLLPLPSSSTQDDHVTG